MRAAIRVHGEGHFKFWIAPPTLVLRDIQNISAVVEMGPLYDVEILDLRRIPLMSGSLGWRWDFELSAGRIALDASGYVQHFRRRPAFRAFQHLELDERGGISYERLAFDGAT